MSSTSSGETALPAPISDLTPLTEKLREKLPLSHAEASGAAYALASNNIPNADKEAFLTALAEKGETADEVAGFVRAFRSLARDPGVEKWAPRAIDVCGTGGDRIGSFNISTTVTFILAAGGVPVLKHGNRSITSKCGSAELLQALGVPLEADDALMHKALDELNFTFFFAPAFHPAFKAIMPVRQALAQRGQRTIFNILGPLINPGRPAHQMVGVFAEAWMSTMAGALDALGLENGMIAHCLLDDGRGMDELSCAGTNRLIGFGRSRGRNETLDATDAGLEPATLDDLTGGDLDRNLELFHQVIDNRAAAGLTDSVLFNAGVAFHIVGKADNIAEGVALGRDLLRSGEVRRLVERTAEFYRS
jgi:anthranilate phosphoribosyltransferase